MNIGFAMCGSFCTYEKVFSAMEAVCAIHTVTPIFSHSAYTIDSRFGTAQEHIARVAGLCGREPLHTIEQVEPLGPKKMLDALVIAPCTGNTLAKLAHSIADGPVTMAAKSHLRNDALAGAAENIGKLLSRKHYYFIPFGQDNPQEKPTSMVADFGKLLNALEAALDGKQLQPILL